MSFPRYPKYTDSGIAWIGKLPEHWELKPLLAIGNERQEKNVDVRETNLLSLSYGNVIPKDINTREGLLPESFETYQKVAPGYIVFRLTDLQNDKRSLRTAIVREYGIITSAYVAFEPKRVHSEFLNFVLRSYDHSKVLYTMGSGVRQSMNFDDLKRLPIVCPSPEEQTQIARFLDHETVKIDALIQQQQRLIELLKEKRQAVISHAVTKGLDPTVPLKDSGVEFLGSIPIGWSIVRFSLEVNIAEGQVDPLNPYFAGLPLIGPEHIESQSGKLTSLESAEQQSAISGKYLCEKGDVIYSKIRPALAKAVIAPEKCLCSADCYPLRCTGGRISNAYLFWFLLSQPFTAWATVTSDRVAMPKVNRRALGNLYLPVPSPNEQADIVKALRNETARTERLIYAVESAIALLQERRSALISAAVTGKIDVRNYAARQTPAAEELYAPA